VAAALELPERVEEGGKSGATGAAAEAVAEGGGTKEAPEATGSESSQSIGVQRLAFTRQVFFEFSNAIKYTLVSSINPHLIIRPILLVTPPGMTTLIRSALAYLVRRLPGGHHTSDCM
jgi:hypothetical protein